MTVSSPARSFSDLLAPLYSQPPAPAPSQVFTAWLPWVPVSDAVLESEKRQARRLREHEAAVKDAIPLDPSAPAIPMPLIYGTGRMGWAEYLDHRRRQALHHVADPNYRTAWPRYQPATVDAACAALASILPDMTWTSLCRDFPPIDQLDDSQRNDLEATTRQAVTVAVGVALHAGQTGKRLTLPQLVDALARRFSDWYRAGVDESKADGVATVGSFTEMTGDRVDLINRDFVRNGIATSKLYDLITKVIPAASGAPFHASKVSPEKRKKGKRIDSGFMVNLIPGPALDTLLAAMEADQEFPKPDRKLLLTNTKNDHVPAQRDRRRVVAGQAYDIAKTGTRHRELFAKMSENTLILDLAGLAGACKIQDARQREAGDMLVGRYHVDPRTKSKAKRDDEVADALLAEFGVTLEAEGTSKRWADLPSTTFQARRARAFELAEQRRGALTDDEKQDLSRWLSQYDRATAFLASHAAMVRQFSEEIDQKAAKDAASGVPSLRHDIEVKTGWSLTINGRYEATHAWLRNTSGKTLDGLKPGDWNLRAGDAVLAPGYRPMDSERANFFRFPGNPLIASGTPIPAVGWDVSSSGDQIQALLLHLDDLWASLRDPKEHKREKYAKAWGYARKDAEPGDKPYSGQDDPVFQGMIKRLGNARRYGGEIGQSMLRFDREPDVYGPGFAGTGAERVKNVEAFEDSLPGGEGLKTFRLACKRVSQVACETGKLTENYRGAAMPDLFDQGVTRLWNAPRMVDIRRKVDGRAVAVKAAGTYQPTPAGRIVTKFLECVEADPETKIRKSIDEVCGVDSEAVLCDLLYEHKAALADVPRMMERVRKFISEYRDRHHGPLDGLDHLKVWGGVKGHFTSLWRFVPSAQDDSGAYAVDPNKVRRQIAPCFTHTLDAFGAGLMMEMAIDRGIPIQVLHDCFMTASVVLDGGELRPGIDVLREINDSPEFGQAFYEGLGPAYDFLIRYLSKLGPDGKLVGDGEPWNGERLLEEKVAMADRGHYAPFASWGAWARGLKATWELRVKECQAGTRPWPTFQVEQAFTTPDGVGNWWADMFWAQVGEDRE